MKKFLIFLILSFNASAADIATINLENVSLTDLVKITYGDMSKTDFIIDSELSKHEKRFTLNVDKLKSQNIKKFLDNLLDREGFEVQKIDSVLTVQKKKDPDLKFISYLPRFRDSRYIQESFRDILPSGAFGTRLPSGIDTANQNQNSQPSTSGNSAYDRGMIQRDEILLKGDKKTIQTFYDFINDIDRPVPEVSITAYIYEVNNSDSSQSSFNLTASLLSDKLGFNLGSGQLLENFLSLKTAGITAVISALASDNRYKVLSSPFMRVADNKNAIFNVGSDVPVLTSIVTNANGQSQQSIEYRNSGVSLNVTPRIKTQAIELKINQELSSFIRTQNGVNNSPTLIKRAVNTTVQAADEDVIVLGGLDENSENKSRSGLPFLPDFLKSLGSQKTDSSILLILHVKRI